MAKKQAKGLSLRISLDEYEALREQAKINDKVITLRKRIVRKDIYEA